MDKEKALFTNRTGGKSKLPKEVCHVQDFHVRRENNEVIHVRVELRLDGFQEYGKYHGESRISVHNCWGECRLNFAEEAKRAMERFLKSVPYKKALRRH